MPLCQIVKGETDWDVKGKERADLAILESFEYWEEESGACVRAQI